MHITFYRRPCLYPDATELFYAYVNGTPAKKSRIPGPCALPKSVMESMMQEACAGVDPADEQVRFYFEPFPLPKYGSSSYTCVARLLAFTYSDWSSPDAEHCVSSMQAAWPLERMQRERIVFSGIAPIPSVLPAAGPRGADSLCQWTGAVPGARRTEGPAAGGLLRLPVPYQRPVQHVVPHHEIPGACASTLDCQSRAFDCSLGAASPIHIGQGLHSEGIVAMGIMRSPASQLP